MSTRMIAPRLHRLLACLACAVGAAVALGPPAAAMPDIMPASQVRPGMKGVGKSVFQGTKVETFGITVLGVLEKMDYGGGDMIVIRVDSGPVVKQRLGIVGGMSGSPVYIEGKLVGAIAWAYTFSSLPIAGVTPIKQMMEAYEPGWSGGAVEASGTWRGDPITISGRTFTKFAMAREGAVAAAAGLDTMVFRPLATPLVVSGLGPAGMGNLTKLLERHDLVPIPGPGPVGKPMHVDLEPGSAVGVQLVSGDIDVSAVGTLTCIDGDRLIAFGHPMLGLGATDVPLTTAYVHGVWPRASMSFKLASPIEPVGHWTQDRMWSIGGTLGGKADMLPTTFRLTDGDRQVSRTFDISAFRDPEWTSYLIVGTLLDALTAISSPNAMERGSQRVGLKVDLEGMPSIERRNAFTLERIPAFAEFLAFLGSPYAFSPLGELYEILDIVSSNPFKRVRIERVEVDFEVSSERVGASLEAVRPNKRVVRPGDQVTLDVIIRPYGEGLITRTIAVRIPEHLPKGKLQIGIAGGQSARDLARSMGIEHARPKSAEQLFARIRERPPNDDLVVELILPTVGLQLESDRLPNLPHSVMEVLQSSKASGIEVLRDHRRSSQRSPWVVSGVKMVTLFIDSDEQNKTGESAPPGSRYPGRGGWADIFMGGMWYGDEYDYYDYEYDRAWRRRLASPIGALLWPDRLRALAAAGEMDIEMPPMPSWEELETLTEEGLEAGLEEETGPGAGKPGKKTKAIARPPGIWVEQTEKDFAKGKVVNAVVADNGEVRLWPALRGIEAATDLCLWAQARDVGGILYIGTWGNGTIYREHGESELEPFADTGAAAVTAMVAAPGGGLYAATYPGGDIVRIDGNGSPAEYCHLDAEYVWALGFDGAGRLWAATGSPAGVYQIDDDGSVEMMFRPPDRHAIALAALPEGGAYVGTYPQGRVYFVDPSGATRGVFEAPTAAVQSLALDADGNLYVGTSPKAFVYRIAPDGTAVELLKARERHITALATDSAGNVYAATGQNGKLYRIAPDRSVSEYRDKGITAVASLAIVDDALTLCGVGSTRVMSGRLDGSVEGEYTSSVHDAAAPARWGRISYTISEGDGEIDLLTRSGNVMVPDETWSAWSPVGAEGGEASAASPPARYIQYRVRIKSDRANHGPALQRVELIYMSKNQPPTLTVKSPQSGEVWSGKKKIRWSADDPDKDKLSYQVFYSGDQGLTWTEIKGEAEESMEEEPEGTEEPAADMDVPGAEPNGGETGAEESNISARLASHGVPVSSRHPVQYDEFDSEFDGMSEFDDTGDLSWDEGGDEEDLFGGSPSGLGSKDMAWDTTEVADGLYVLKVVATDRDANPDDPITVERITPPVRVDNTPPKITSGASRHLLTPPRALTIADAVSRVASAEYRVDDGEWHATAAVDGIFDNLTETIEIDPGALLVGRHAVEVRMRDGAGNETTEEIRYFMSKLSAPTE